MIDPGLAIIACRLTVIFHGGHHDERRKDSRGGELHRWVSYPVRAKWYAQFKRLLLRFERMQQRHYGMKLLASTLMNLRAFCGA
jgi:hypothetical protein